MRTTIDGRPSNFGGSLLNTARNNKPTPKPFLRFSNDAFVKVFRPSLDALAAAGIINRNDLTHNSDGGSVAAVDDIDSNAQRLSRPFARREQEDGETHHAPTP